MYIKVFPHGQGGGDGPVNYLIRLDYPKRDESLPVILRGDADMTRNLIDAQTRKWKFNAGVCSCGPEDTVTPEQERRLMDDFDRPAFAGWSLTNTTYFGCASATPDTMNYTSSYPGWNSALAEQ